MLFGLEEAMVKRPSWGMLPFTVFALERVGLQVSLKRDLMYWRGRSFGWYSQWRKSFGAAQALELGRSGAASMWCAAARKVESMSLKWCLLIRDSPSV